MSHVLALDIGTQSARAAVVTGDGDLLGIAQIEHAVDSPCPGWAQQRAEDWWNGTCQATHRVLDDTGVSPASITAVAACGQMHGPAGVDGRGNVTTPWVQLWCDKRCAPEADAICRRCGEARLTELAGSPPNPAWTGIKVRWIKDNQPDVYAASRWFLAPKDFINFRLTGVAATDPSEASGSFLWDCRTGEYSPELAEAVGVDLAKFAAVHPSHTVIGQVTVAAAAQTGISKGTPVVAGGGDFPVSMLGLGLVGEGATADVTGTSTLLAVHSARPLIHPAIQNLRHAVDGWIAFTLLDCGGLSMKWCKDFISSALGRELGYDELIMLAQQAPEGSAGLLFLPYLLGERRRENATARGGFSGITLTHAAPHFVRAVMEGVALGMGKDLAQFRKLGLNVDRIFSMGGGTRNALWNQIKADVLQRPLEIADEPEAGLKGAALLGSAGAGLIADPAATAVSRRAATRTVTPRKEYARLYAQAQSEFIRIYDHMLGFWQG